MNGEKENKKGFTLLELLATIVILSLVFVVGAFFITGLLDDSSETVDNVTKKLILDAAEQYAIEFRDNPEWSEEVDSDGNVSFCINLNSLVNYDYLNNNENKLVTQYKSQYFVKTTVVNGVYNYELMDIDDVESNCKYFYKQTITDNGNGSIPITENGSSIGNFEYKVTKINDRLYDAYLNFSIDFEIEVNERRIPTYVSIVLDNSGSMAGNKYNDAVAAASNFSKSIIEQISDAKIAIIKYDSTAKIINPFENKKYETLDFGSCSSTVTNTSGGIDAVSALIYNGKNKKEGYTEIDEDANIFTVLLYDGIPNRYYKINGISTVDISNENDKNNYFSNFITSINDNSFSCSSGVCIKIVQSSANILKNDFGSKLIVIGYEMDDVDSRLKTIATQDNDFCSIKDEVGNIVSGYTEDSSNYYCYYDSDTDNIETLFSKISSTIIENVRSTNAKYAKVSLESPVINDEKAFVIKQNGEVIESIEETIQIEGTNESKELTVSGNYQLVINENIFGSCVDEQCVVDLDSLFDIKIGLFYGDNDGDGVEEYEEIKIDTGNLPSFTVTVTETDKVN